MKIAVTLCLLVLIEIATADVWSFTGNTTGVTTRAFFPDYNSQGCNKGYASAAYVTQDINVTTSNYYVLTALFDEKLVGDGIISIYSNYYPSNTCNGSVAGYFSNNADAPHIYIPVWLDAAVYTVVVTADGAAPSGAFAFQLKSVDWYGSVSSNSNYWNFPGSSNTPTVCTASSTSVPYTYYTWTQMTSGLFDINVWGRNLSQSYTAVTGLWNITASDLPFIGEGTQASPVDPCANTTSSFVIAHQSDSNVNLPGGEGLVYGNIWLSAGTNYTLVVSQNKDIVVTFGITISTTIYHSLGTTPNFPTPPTSATPSTCVPSESTKNLWDATLFSTVYPYVIVATGDVADGFPPVISFYYGNNTGSADQSIPPAPCTNFIQSTYKTPSVFAANGGNYTAVVSPNDPNLIQNGLYTLYVYTGTVIASSPSTTGAVATTGAATTGAATTGAATTGAATTGADTTGAATTGAATTGADTTGIATTEVATTAVATTGAATTGIATTGVVTTAAATGVITGAITGEVVTTAATSFMTTGLEDSGASHAIVSIFAFTAVLLAF